MAFEQRGNGGSAFKKFPTTYYGYTEPDEPKENYKRLKKDEFVEGYFLKTWERDGMFGKQKNHTLVKTDGTHHVIPGSKDVDVDFELAVKGQFTRYTYLGKVAFEYESEDGKKGKAKAIKGLIQQDPDNTCTFNGDEYTATPEGNATPTEASTDAPGDSMDANANFDSDDIPF